MQPDDKPNPNPNQSKLADKPHEAPASLSLPSRLFEPEANIPPVVTAIGSVAAQPEVDKSNLAEAPDADTDTAVPILPAPNPVSAAPSTASIPDASQQPVSQLANGVAVKLPVPTTLLPAFLIGFLILVLFLAVVLYAFVL